MPNLHKQLRQLIDKQDVKELSDFLEKEETQHNLLNGLCSSGVNALFYALTPPIGQQVSEEIIDTLLSRTHVGLHEKHYGCELTDTNQKPEIQALFKAYEKKINADWRTYIEPVAKDNPLNDSLITHVATLNPKLRDWMSQLPESVFVELKERVNQQTSVDTLYEQALELALENGELNGFPFKSGTEIKNRDLRGADFGKSDLSQVTFIQCDLRLSNLYDNGTFDPARVKECILDRYTFTDKQQPAAINADKLLSHDNAFTNQYSNSETCLHMAVHNNSKFLPTLLNRSSLRFLNSTNLQGNTMWHLCALENNLDAMKKIKGKCNEALFKKQNRAGDTALHIAASSSADDEFFASLINNDLCTADILSLKNTRGLTAAQVAVENHQFVKLAEILKKDITLDCLGGIDGKGKSIIDKLKESEDDAAHNCLHTINQFPESELIQLNQRFKELKSKRDTLVKHLNKVLGLLEGKITYLNHNDAAEGARFIRTLCADLRQTMESDMHNLQAVFNRHLNKIEPKQTEEILRYRGVFRLLNRLYDWVFPESVAVKPGNFFAPKTETSRLLNQLQKDVEDVQQTITPESPAR